VGTTNIVEDDIYYAVLTYDIHQSISDLDRDVRNRAFDTGVCTLECCIRSSG
jgi:hypothetical protein